MLHYNIWFDVCSFAVMAILLIIYSMRKSIKILQNNVFFALMIAEMLETVTDMQSVFSDGLSRPLVETFNYMYFVSSVSVTFFYALYTASILNYHIHRRKVIREFLLPASAAVLILATNPFTHMIFSVSKEAVYHRGWFMWALYAVYVYYVLYGLVHIIRYRKHISRERLMMLFPFTIMIFVGAVIEIAVPFLAVKQFCSTLCIVILYFGIQNPDELYDKKTGFLNYTAFITLCDTRLSSDASFQCISICIHDVDIMKNSFGLSGMDELISEHAAFLKQFSRKCLIYRIDEGRYCLVPDYDDREYSYEVFRSIAGRLEQPFDIDNNKVIFSSTCCMFECPGDAYTAAGMIDVMNMAAETGKARNMTVVSTADLDLKHEDYMREIDEKVRNAISADKLEVYYQPIYSTVKNRYVAAEALVRMHDEEHGFISPDVFIPVAEKNGMIIDIGRFVLEEVCRMSAEERLEQYGIEYIEVNMSLTECIQDDIAENVEHMLEKYSIDPSGINLEITETASDAFTQVVNENLREMNRFGIEFSLDDFGTGYSSANRILEMPLKIIKLDKTIVQPAFLNDDAKTLLDCSVDMVKKLGMEIVAEGVETKEQAEEIIRLGCDYIQGFYFSRPVPRNEFINKIREGKAAVSGNTAAGNEKA